MLGIEADLGLSLKWGWAVDLYDKLFGEDVPPIVSLAGVVISGDSKILIGG